MAGNVNVDITGDEKKYLQSLQRAIEGTAKLEQRLGHLAETATKAGRTGQQAFGQTFGNGISSLMAKITMMGGGIGAVVGIMQRANQKAEEGIQQLQQSRKSFGELMQLAETEGQKKRLVRAAQLTYLQGAGESQEEATSLVYELQSSGALDQRKLYAELAASKLVRNVVPMAKAAGTLIASMGADETGSHRDLLNKMFVAGKVSPGTAEAVGTAGAQAGARAKMLGWSDEEVLSTVAVLSKTSGSPEIAATQLNSMLAAMVENGGFKGLGAMKSIEKIIGMGMDDANLSKWFGRKEGIIGHAGFLQNRDLVEQTIRETYAAQQNDVLGQKMQFARNVPGAAAVDNLQLSKALEEMATAEQKAKMAVADSVLNRRTADFESQPGALNYMTSMIGGTIDWALLKTMGPDAFMRTGDFTPQERAAWDKTVTEYAAERKELQDASGSAWGNDRAGEIVERLSAVVDKMDTVAERMANGAIPSKSPTLGGPNHDPGGK